MPVKNVIFDLGRVLFNWNPEEVAKDFTSDPQLQELVCNGIFYHKDWDNLDAGLFTEDETFPLSLLKAVLK